MKALTWFLLFAIIFFAIASGRKTSRPSPVKYLFYGFVLLVIASYGYTTGQAALRDYLPYLLAGTLFLFFEFDDDFFPHLFFFFEILFWVFIGSMYLELISPELFRRLFSFLSLGNSLVVRVDGQLAIAGLAFEKGYAAFLCNMGLGVLFARIFSGRLTPSLAIQVVVVFAALMMTGKRTLFLIPLFGVLAFILLFARSHKVITAIAVALAVSLLLFVAYAFVPQVSLVFDRFLADNGDPLSGREVFWTYAIQMFLASPLIGMGFLSFNEYTNSQGFLYYGEPWTFQAHNVYIQVLAELGAVGLILFVSMLLFLLFGLAATARSSRSVYVLAAFYWALLIAVYSLTGNTIYYACQLFVLVITIAIYLKYGARRGGTFAAVG